MPMSENTKQALEDSIAHWEHNVENARLGRAIDISAGACALCCMFYIPHKDCEGCPVAAIGCDYCENTPYISVREIMGTRSRHPIVKACQAELDFLISLRSEEIK